MLRGAVIGFGRMGLTHFSILNTHPDVKFVAVYDPSAFVLKNAESFLGSTTYKDYVNTFSETRPDFVIVATPTEMYTEVLVGTGPMVIEDGPPNDKR